ncbi:putative bifunctional diguanylate cyclase/phosphodiesterase [Angustibacter aerolatus]
MPGLLGDPVAGLLTEGVLLVGADGRVEQVNAAATHLLGDDLVGETPSGLLAPALRADGRPVRDGDNPVLVVLATGRASTQLLSWPVPGSAARQLQVRAVPLPPVPDDVDVPPAPRAVAVVVTEVEGDLEGIRALRDREHLLGVAQRMAELSVWRYSLGSTNVEWLDGGQRLAGLDDERRGLDAYLEGIHPDDRAAHDALLYGLFAQEGSGEVDLRYRWQGGWRHWHLWAESVLGADGQVTALWGTTQDVTARREAEAAVRHLSMTDALTELPNRAQVLERLGTALSAVGHSGSTALLVLDVDHFAGVNARHGQSVGDELLVAVGGRLAAVADELRTAGRLSADEFAVLVEHTTPAEALELAHRLHRDLSRPYLLPGAGEPLTIGVSVGVALHRSGERTSAGELYRHAALAVDAGQAAGGAAVVPFDESLRAVAAHRLDLEQQLRTALVEGAVRPAYQPVLTLGATAADDRMTSCEALARMTAGGRAVPPTEFVAVAETAGLVVDLDVAVFSQAVREVLERPPVAGFGVAVNLSPLSLQVPGISGRIATALQQSGVDGRSLRVEITEGSLAEPTSVLVRNLGQLRELGVQLGLDDFGTGYSALAYLRRFDLDFMKIDRSFVADVTLDRRSAAVVRAVVDLAHAHDLHVVAEGIETAEQLESLRAMGCDMVQGFHLGRPMPLDALRRAASTGTA